MFRDGIKRWLTLFGHAFNHSVHQRLDGMEVRMDNMERCIPPNRDAELERILKSQVALLKSSVHLAESLQSLSGRTLVETAEPRVTADIALITFLYSYLPSRVAVEVGAHDAESTRALLQAGYDVHSVKSADLVYAAEASSHQRSAGYLAPVMVDAAGLIDIAGDPLIGLQSMNGTRAHMIAADCSKHFADVVADLRSREYHWHVVIVRSKEGAVSAFSGGTSLPPDSSGRAFFFRDFSIFAEAQTWCTAALPRTFFV